MSRKDKFHLCEVIDSDTQFLKDLNIMDYSLLLGIEKKTVDWTKARNRMNERLVIELIDKKA